jgi:SAM-dependent methyltransferase
VDVGDDIVISGDAAVDLRRREFEAFERTAAAYSANMAQTGRPGRTRLLTLAELGPELSLLDVCTGPGWLAIDGAAACPGGRAVGVDLSSAMIEQARANAVTAGRNDVEFAVMDAQALDLPDASFDRVVCGLGLMHAPDPRAALKEMARVARPGARLAASVWAGASETIMGTMAEALRAVAGDRLLLDYSYVTRLGEAGVLERVLGETGWQPAGIERFESGGVIPDAQIIWAAFAQGTTYGTLVADLPPDDRERVRLELAARCEVFRRPDGLHIPAVQLLATATR